MELSGIWFTVSITPFVTIRSILRHQLFRARPIGNPAQKVKARIVKVNSPGGEVGI